jgi:serine/threonine protein kinase
MTMTATRHALPRPHVGSFELLDKIGQGATGTIYKARGPNGDGLVAIKIAHRHLPDDVEPSDGVHRESPLLDKLRHPNIARELARGEDHGLLFRVMEHVPGTSLARHLQEIGPMPMAQAMTVFSALLNAAALLHKHNIVHGDIKPASVLLPPSAGPKLSDMGLLQDLATTASGRPTRFRLGTMEFVAPELFDDGNPVDARSDLYALAATLYVTLTGRAVFGPGNLGAVLTRKLNHQLTPLAELIPEASTALDSAVTRALNPDPEARPSSAEELFAALVSAKSHDGPMVDQAATAASLVAAARRSSTRYPIDMVLSCQLATSTNDILCEARVLDISTGGVCVEIPEHVAANRALQITLPGPDAGQGSAYRVGARWLKQLSNGNCMVGFAFSNPLEESDLERLLAR